MAIRSAAARETRTVKDAHVAPDEEIRHGRVRVRAPFHTLLGVVEGRVGVEHLNALVGLFERLRVTWWRVSDV